MISEEHPLFYRGKAASRQWVANASTVPDSDKHRFYRLCDPSWVLVKRVSSGRRLGLHPGYTKTYYEYWQETDGFYYLYTSYKQAFKADVEYYVNKIASE